MLFRSTPEAPPPPDPGTATDMLKAQPRTDGRGRQAKGQGLVCPGLVDAARRAKATPPSQGQLERAEPRRTARPSYPSSLTPQVPRQTGQDQGPVIRADGSGRRAGHKGQGLVMPGPGHVRQKGPRPRPGRGQSPGGQV